MFCGTDRILRNISHIQHERVYGVLQQVDENVRCYQVKSSMFYMSEQLIELLSKTSYTAWFQIITYTNWNNQCNLLSSLDWDESAN